MDGFGVNIRDVFTRFGFEEQIARKMLEDDDLRKQAQANNKANFYASPDLWPSIQGVIVDTDDAQHTGHEVMAAERKKREVMAVFALLRLWETLRDTAARPTLSLR